MAQDTKIEWTTHTANLWHGCAKVHEGCDNCYAEAIARRWNKDVWGNDKPRLIISSVWDELVKFEKLAREKGERHTVFVGSMMDIFEKPMPMVNSKGIFAIDASDGSEICTDVLRDQLFFNITRGDYPHLTFLFLTKRPGNINKYIPEAWKANPPYNVMFGTSVSTQKNLRTLAPQF